MNFITISNLNETVCRNLHKIPADVDLVVGIPRSGMLAASLIGLYLNVPITDIDAFLDKRIYSLGDTRKNRSWIKSIEEARKILIVDDSVSMGDAIKGARKKVEGFKGQSQLIFAAVYTTRGSSHLVDVSFENCRQPRMFEWNYLHHWGLEYACMDIDGVLCEDPGFFENDDGRRYEKFLKNAKPKFIPTKKVKKIVTSRLEKYRQLTAEWLKLHKIEYTELVMADFDSAIERAISGAHGEFKGKVYRESDCMLFIESNYVQALEICRISGKQVFCTDNNQLVTPDNLFKKSAILKRDIVIVIKQGIKKILSAFFKKQGN